jgi:hypothetical protein
VAEFFLPEPQTNAKEANALRVNRNLCGFAPLRDYFLSQPIFRIFPSSALPTANRNSQ